MPATQTRYRSYAIEVPSTRIDEVPWTLPVHEFVGAEGGAATAIISGLTGDKPLGIVALHELIEALKRQTLAGTVIVMPLVNPYGFQAGMRADPDLVELNRRFPGDPKGLVSDQIAHALFQFLSSTVTAVLDLHSGTVVRTTEYAYDYDNLPFSAAFGLVPVMVGQAIPGQLCTALRRQGVLATLVEFGGPDRTGTSLAVEGCLNVLRYRGHLDDEPTGPGKVEIIDKVQKVQVSTDGIFRSPFGPGDVGRRIPVGDLGYVMNAASGRVLERFEVVCPAERPGEPILMLASTTPVMVRPGELVYILGWTSGDMAVPRRTDEMSVRPIGE